MSVGGTTGSTPGSSNPGAPGNNNNNNGIGTLAGMNPGDLRATLGNLSASDLSKLKVACSDVLSNPSAYSADMRAVCTVIASI